VPFNGIPDPAPLVSRAVPAHAWSALRFSQPPSGFCTDRVPRPYFMPQPFLDYPPSESSPREDRAPLSGPLAPLQSSTVLRNVPLVTLLPEVSPTPTLLTQLPGSPTSYESPFHESEGSLPGRSGSPTAGSPLPLASPASKLSSLRESVRTGPGCPGLSGRYSPGLLPLLRPNRPNLGSSNPPEPLRTQARTLSRRIEFVTPETESTSVAG
jgi:hypothetical protein